jgi:hypothetical protein
MLDELLLLGRGGRTVYLGPTWLAMPYFTMLGWECPPAENPGDYLLDIVTGSEANQKDRHMTRKVRCHLLLIRAQPYQTYS